jgi:hypothetical protein
MIGMDLGWIWFKKLTFVLFAAQNYGNFLCAASFQIKILPPVTIYSSTVWKAVLPLFCKDLREFAPFYDNFKSVYP